MDRNNPLDNNIEMKTFMKSVIFLTSSEESDQASAFVFPRSPIEDRREQVLQPADAYTTIIFHLSSRISNNFEDIIIICIEVVAAATAMSRMKKIVDDWH